VGLEKILDNDKNIRQVYSVADGLADVVIVIPDSVKNFAESRLIALGG
jgi:hypothetical protein